MGYDGTQPTERALARAAQLAHTFGARITVADVAAPEPLQTTSGAFGFAPYYPNSAEQSKDVTEELWRQHRARIESFFADAGVTHEFSNVIGQPPEEIVETAERHKADLIAVRTREPGFLERLLEGSVSQGVARRAHCDVLIVHPEDGADGPQRR